MAAKTQITNKGLELMASSSKATGQHWWLGWYALAYVPDELQEEEGEKLSPAMTKLTKDGDIIYNIFQGDMNGDGYQTTKASSRFKSVNYDSNIKKNYRYVLDEDGRNNLVTFVDGKHGLKGAFVYKGVHVLPSIDNNEINHDTSKIPLPAPLLYTGVLAAGEGWSTDSMEIFLGSGNDSIDKFYPVDKVKVEGENRNVPRVSTDFRNYEGYKNGLKKLDSGDDYDHALGGDDFNGVDFDGWFPAVNTYTQDDETDMGEDYNQYCKEYWKVLSISNFNKYCAPVNASGLVYDENTGCRNMAKATKYFPISDYSVTSTAKTEDNEYATGIKLHVELKLNGNAEDGAYFKEVETGTEGNVATLNPSPSTEDQALFNTQKVSFKFNRIGIYAVPMRQYGCSNDSSEMAAQFQIDTEAEPVLFAVCEWDSPVTVSDSGEGLSEFQSDIFIDLSAAVDDSSVIRESAVFYNLYEDDAIDWYKNQLVANASIAEALVNMQIEMGYLRNQKNAKQGCCPKQEAIQQNSKSVAGLRNLVDAKDYNSNSVRNRLAQEEGKVIEPQYSDIRPDTGSVGHPTTTVGSGIAARKSTSGASDVYSAFYGMVTDGRYAVDYEDATFDEDTSYERTYVKMVPSGSAANGKAIRFGKLWLRTSLYYELYSFVEPSSPVTSIAWDYPDDADTNEFNRITGYVTDYVGYESLYLNLPYVEVVKTESGVTTTDRSTTPPTVIQGLPQGIIDVDWLNAEINRDFQNYETKRSYTVYYNDLNDNRDYDYTCERTTTLSLPKIQMYKLNKTVFSNINKHLKSTGWRIPSTEDWASIISDSEKEQEKIAEIRSAAKWGVSGGTGEVYPLSGLYTSQGAIRPTVYTGASSVIYLAIADDDLQVVKFDGTSFEIVSKNLPGEAALSYVAILCVCDATKVSDGISKYKLGYDSYSLMEGSITEGDHNFNAGEKSVILASAKYNSIFGGMYNKVKDSSHNAILNGYSNEISGAVFSTVFGNNNILEMESSWPNPACRMLVGSENTHIKGGATAAIFAEGSIVERAYQASIIADKCDVKEIYCSRFIGQYSDVVGPRFSDMITYRSHHLPSLYMSRGIFTDDHVDTLPSSMNYAKSVNVNIHYSDILGRRVHFWDKAGNERTQIQIDFSHLAAGDGDVGIVHTYVTYSDIFAYGDAKKRDYWYNGKTLDSLCINYSRIALCESSLASDYVSSDVASDNFYNTGVNFCDISLADCLVSLIEQSGTPHKFDFGVMKLSHSILTKCDASYVYESGTMHYLASSQMHYATLVGQAITLSSNYIRNTHIYGSLKLPSGTSLANHIILGGLDGTNVGELSASSYISEFGSFIANNHHNYPMIWSLGGIGLYMNKMILGNKGVSSTKAPSVGDVLSVVGVEDNMATVAWKAGGASGGSSDIIVFQDDGVVMPYASGRQFVTYTTENVATATAIRYSLFQNGQFTTFGNDAEIPLFRTPVTGSAVPYGLRPYGTNHIVWNTWYSIKAYGLFEGETVSKVKDIVNGTRGVISTGNNALSTMVVVTDALVEGLVYEVTVNVRSIAKLCDSESGATSPGGDAYGTMTAPSKFESHFGLAFCKEDGTSVTAKRWADNTQSVNRILYPRFNPVPSDGNGFGFGPGSGTGIQPPVIAAAKVYFVKVGSDIFVMAY